MADENKAQEKVLLFHAAGHPMDLVADSGKWRMADLVHGLGRNSDQASPRHRRAYIAGGVRRVEHDRLTWAGGLALCDEDNQKHPASLQLARAPPVVEKSSRYRDTGQDRHQR